jgi:hypothetical protein
VEHCEKGKILSPHHTGGDTRLGSIPACGRGRQQWTGIPRLDQIFVGIRLGTLGDWAGGRGLWGSIQEMYDSTASGCSQHHMEAYMRTGQESSFEGGEVFRGREKKCV